MVLPGLTLSLIMSSAASRSAVPLASVNLASTISPWRFSVIICPMWESLASLPRPLRMRRASGSVVCFIGSFLTVEVAPGIAAAALGRLIGAVLRHEALHAGPSLDQRAVDREVLARQKLAHLRQIQNPSHELGRDIAAQEPVAVLAEHGCVPYRIVRR